ncbi:hypothetical protein [Cruoricaptor ignavus]|uniref:hypothetical protein n=1 Tax=Cruoricaptor ignavus TaxID=1118202 RepID=UPI0013562BC6|nr:hypothetical protein [Cruoricaptor ignavus]
MTIVIKKPEKFLVWEKILQCNDDLPKGLSVQGSARFITENIAEWKKEISRCLAA